MSEARRWRCKNGHTLGVTRRARVDGHHVTRLELFRQAVGEDLEAVDVMAVVEGTVLDVRCSVCGATRTWVVGSAALERLLDDVKRNVSA